MTYENKKNHGWILTDGDLFQIRRELKKGVFELYQIQLFSSEPERIFVIAHSIVDVNEFGPDEINEILESYGYDSIDKMKELYGEDANGILAEAQFEIDAGCYDNILSTRRAMNNIYNTIKYVKSYSWEEARDMIKIISGYEVSFQ